jgi:integrase/recombinase XerD
MSDLPNYRAKIKRHELDYFNLSGADKAIALATSPRDYATVKQINSVIQAMPFESEVEKRNKVLVSLLFLTGARISALISLKIKHVDLNLKSINQHPKEVKTKNRKRIKTYFFPVGQLACDVMIDYSRFLIQTKTMSKNDPLFPRNLPGEPPLSETMLGITEWKSTTSARKIITGEFEKNGLPGYCPHSFRNSLTQLA